MQKECEKYLDGSTTNGLIVVMTRYVEDYRNLKNSYDELKKTYSGSAL